MADHEKWLAVVRQLTTGHHSKAREVWERLNQNQRGLVLHSAGLKSFYCRYAWSDFSNRELCQIKRGIQRLSALVEMFGKIGDLAFVQPKKITVTPDAAAHVVADMQINALIEARNQLRAPVVRGDH
ncbi:hypothetical protein [Pseudomonas graminis]